MPKLPSKLLLWVISASVVLLIFSILIIIPTATTIDQTVADIRTLQQKKMINSDNLKDLITLKKRSLSLDADIYNLDQAFISENNPLPFVTRVEDLATQHQVVLQMHIGQPDKAVRQTIKPVVTDLTFIGSWDDCMAYLQALMADPTYITIKQLSLASGADQMTVTLRALTYWRQ